MNLANIQATYKIKKGLDKFYYLCYFYSDLKRSKPPSQLRRGRARVPCFLFNSSLTGM